MFLHRSQVRSGFVALGTVALLTPALALPAHAAHRVFTDPDDALGADIRRVRVVNTSERVVVRAKLDRIVKDGRSRAQALSLFVDTDFTDARPEYVLATGLNEGTDWTLRKISSWGSVGKTVRCPHTVRINWRTDRVRLAIARSCLGEARSVRIALKSMESTASDGEQIDWLTARRTFTSRVALD